MIRYLVVSLLLVVCLITYFVLCIQSDEFDFPTREEALRMARLSELVYDFKGYQHCNATSQDTGAPILPDNLDCHFYSHDMKQGTQVLIVSPKKKLFRRKPWLAVVFAGTDDVRTSIADGNIFLKPFGPLDEKGLSILMPGKARVHAGFDNSVFHNQLNLYPQIKQIVYDSLRKGMKLYTTGHSLGAASAVLLGTALVLDNTTNARIDHVRCISFGCPRIGNQVFSDKVNSLSDRLEVWRFVLGWDLVPRLPEYPFQHAGHTLQMIKGNITKGYFQHRGNATRGFQGVPWNWGSTPFIWVPGAITSHFMKKYQSRLGTTQMVAEFEKTNGTEVADDDYYINPPDDFIAMGDDLVQLY